MTEKHVLQNTLKFYLPLVLCFAYSTYHILYHTMAALDLSFLVNCGITVSVNISSNFYQRFSQGYHYHATLLNFDPDFWAEIFDLKARAEFFGFKFSTRKPGHRTNMTLMEHSIRNYSKWLFEPSKVYFTKIFEITRC